MDKRKTRQQFAEMIKREESAIELDLAALLIATEEYPALQIKNYLSHLDLLAEEIRQKLTLGELFNPLECATQISQFLFYEGRFNGNNKDYYNIRNSFLNEVIDRGKGIPITLSIIFIEVARRLGVSLFGVGMPGHFLVKYADDQKETFFDPFNGGKILDENECRKIFQEMYTDQSTFDRSFLYAVSKKQILSRMLQNLKSAYFRASDMQKAFDVVERLLIISPGATLEIRDRGLIGYSLKQYSQAYKDLEKYLMNCPEAEDRGKIREVMKDIRLKQAQLN